MKLLLLSTNNQDYTVTVVVDGVRYEYWFRPLSYFRAQRNLELILQKGGDGKALSWLKSHSWKCDRLRELTQ